MESMVPPVVLPALSMILRVGCCCNNYSRVVPYKFRTNMIDVAAVRNNSVGEVWYYYFYQCYYYYCTLYTSTFITKAVFTEAWPIRMDIVCHPIITMTE